MGIGGFKRRGTALALSCAFGLGILTACVPEAVHPNMSPAGGFFTTPWPNDIRTRPDGSIDLAGFPGRWNGTVNTIMQRGAPATRGFGTNSAAYFTFDGTLAEGSLPDPVASAVETSPVQLVNLDPDSPNHMARTPARVTFRPQPSLYRPAFLLSVQPYPGFPLEQGITYGVVLFSGLRDKRGQAVAPASYLSRLEEPWSTDTGRTEADFTALQAQWGDVKEYVSEATPWDESEIVGFTVYTTGSYRPRMQAVADAVETLAPPQVVDAVVAKTCGTGNPNHLAVDGHVDVPRWQSGVSPYLNGGGEIVVSGGLAQQQATERVRYRIAFPCQDTPPGGWPVLVVIGGTGSGYDTATSGFVDRYYPAGTDLPFAVASIAPYFSGDREDPGIAAIADRLAGIGISIEGLDLSALAYFNFFNPVAGRDNQFQQASEILFLKRVAQGFAMDASVAGTASDLTTDADSVSFYGHSQGAGPAPLALAADDDFDAALLSGASAGLYHALLHRGDIRPLVDTLMAVPPNELDEAHPVLQVLQTMIEASDPSNHASDVGTPALVMLSGIHDGCSPFEGAQHLATAMGLDVAAPPLTPVFGIETLLGRAPVPLPAAANLPGGRTGILLELDAGHFGNRANPATVRGFFDSVAAGSPAVPAGPFAPETDQTECLRHD